MCDESFTAMFYLKWKEIKQFRSKTTIYAYSTGVGAVFREQKFMGKN
jgi:hypothetical protein